MPTYDYECDACGHRFELFQSISADPEKKCPECKKLKLRRLIGTGAAVVFKGSGFYQTDYRSDSYKKSAAADSSPSSSSSEKASSEKSSSEKSTSDKSTNKSAGGSSSSSEKKTKKKD
ncbi:MAG: FmdB family zinc ribbon protein [Planctomycetota bacterium]|jgi:putative FmdB family regulatory protein